MRAVRGAVKVTLRSSQVAATENSFGGVPPSINIEDQLAYCLE